MFAVMVGLLGGVSPLAAQGTTNPGQSAGQTTGQAPAAVDNPFPGEAPQAPTPQKPADGAKPTSKPDAGDGTPASDNPFPGETTDAPILPADPGANSGTNAGSGSGQGTGADSASGARRESDANGDPVRSPDAPGSAGDDDAFSSSRTGLGQMPVEDDNDGKPGKSTKNKTREQVVKENLDVGRFYLEQKNWRGAQARFSAAVSLDPENPDSVLGLAQAEQHLGLWKQASEHYQLFLTYDPDGPHSKAARKGLEEVEAGLAATSNRKQGPSRDGVPLK